MAERKHTELPFNLPLHCYKNSSGYYTVEDADDVMIATRLMESKARYLVTVCNNHYKLLDALNKIADLGCGDEVAVDCQCIAMKAIAEAKGGV